MAEDKWTAVAEAMEARAKEEREMSEKTTPVSGAMHTSMAKAFREAAAMVRNAMGEGDDADT